MGLGGGVDRDVELTAGHEDDEQREAHVIAQRHGHAVADHGHVEPVERGRVRVLVE